MTPMFTFLTDSASGTALRGRVELSAGSISNRASFYAEPGWIGSLQESDKIEISVSSFASDIEDHQFPVFSGIISRILPRGDRFFVECVSSATYMILDAAPVKAWSNKTVRSIFTDLVKSSRFPFGSALFFDTFGNTDLHCWNTDGGKVAHELTELLAANAPGTLMFSTVADQLAVGTRLELAKMLPPWPFPSDCAGSPLAAGFVDSEATEFTLRPTSPHQVVYEIEELGLMGTVDAVVHEIQPGRSVTSVIVDWTPCDGLSDYLDTLK